MNDTLIEKLLSQSPQPVPPPNLLAQLESQIVLPAAPTRNGVTAWRLLLRRWMPTIAFGIFLLSCVTMTGVQAVWISRLKEQNQKLRNTADSLAQAQASEAAAANLLKVQMKKLRQLREDHAELLRLRQEVDELRQLPSRTAELQAANRQLATKAVAAGNTDEQFFADASKAVERIECVNNLKYIGLAARLWSQDEQGRFPTSLVSMSNEVASVSRLICPSDTARQANASVPWNQFRDEMSSYQFFGTGGKDDLFPDSVLYKCPIHHNYGLADGSVQSVNPDKFREVKREGRLYLELINAAPGQ